MIAALYIDPRGPYPKMPDVDAWDERRDARLYAGPWPVVAHPPCGPWGRLRHLSKRPGDRELAPLAVWDVRRFGGVLEHPARSQLWPAMSLPSPGGGVDAFGGYSVEVCQVEWGHVARKRTWLYLVGVPRSALEAPPLLGREPTHWISGFRSSTRRPPKRYRGNGVAVPPGIRVCSSQQRRRTPEAFAAYLVRLAASAAPAQRRKAC